MKGIVRQTYGTKKSMTNGGIVVFFKELALEASNWHCCDDSKNNYNFLCYQPL